MKEWRKKKEKKEKEKQRKTKNWRRIKSTFFLFNFLGNEAAVENFLRTIGVPAFIENLKKNENKKLFEQIMTEIESEQRTETESEAIYVAEDKDVIFYSIFLIDACRGTSFEKKDERSRKRSTEREGDQKKESKENEEMKKRKNRKENKINKRTKDKKHFLSTLSFFLFLLFL